MSDDTEPKSLAYIDSSATVKLILPEPESQDVVNFIEDLELVSSRLVDIETRRAVSAAEADDETIARMEIVLEAINLVEIAPTIADAAGALGPSSLRTLDAIHLATALSFGEELKTMIAFDTRLGRAARSHGLAVESPGSRSRT